jgi:hypothetical protein
VSPVPSHEALQYLPSGCGGHEHGGFLQVSSSAMISPLIMEIDQDYGGQSLTQVCFKWHAHPARGLTGETPRATLHCARHRLPGDCGLE